MSDFQNFVEDRVRIAAFRLAPIAGVVDQTGRDRDDYESLLRMQVLEGLAQLEEQPEKTVDKYRWVTTVLKNRTTDCRRELTTARTKLVDVEDNANLPDTTTADLETTVCRREAIRRLKAAISIEDWALLVSYVELDTVRDTWRASGVTTSERAFGRKLQSLSELSKEILQKLLD